MNIISALFLIAICCCTSLCNKFEENEEIEVQFRVKDYQNVDGFEHLSAMSGSRFTIRLSEVYGEEHEHIETKTTSEPYDRASFKLAREMFIDDDELMEEGEAGKFSYMKEKEFRVLIVAQPIFGFDPKKFTRMEHFKLTFDMKTVFVVFSVRNDKITVNKYDQGPVRFMQFQIQSSLKFVRIECSYLTRHEWEMDFEKSENQIAFENAVCPQDGYKIVAEQIKKAKDKLGRHRSRDFELQCEEARFEPPYLNLYKVVWSNARRKYDCLLDMEKSGKVMVAQPFVRERTTNIPTNAHPKSRKGQAAADLNVANTLLSLQTPVDHEKAVQPVQKQEEVDDEKIKVYSRRKNKTDEAGTSNTKSVVGKRKSIAREQEKLDKSMEKAKSKKAKRLKVKKHGNKRRIVPKNAVIKAESSLPMAIEKVPNEFETAGDEHKEREMDNQEANIAEKTNNAAEFVGEAHAEKSSDDDDDDDVAEALLSLQKLPEAQHTEHEMQDRVGDVQHVHQQKHVDSDITLKESGEKKIHVASSSKKIKKGKGVANKKGEKGRKKAKLEKDTLKSLQIRLNKLDERWTEHVPRLTRLGIKIPSEDSPDQPGHGRSPSPEIHGIGAGNSPETAPLIEDVRNEVAEPAGDEHNGMEAEGNGREMVLAESAPQEGKMDVENVPRLTKLGIKIPSEHSPDHTGQSPEIHDIVAGNSPEIAPLIEDVRNEVAEPAGDEHNGMEEEGNGREMVLAEGAENAPQEGNVEVGNENYAYDHGPMDVADYADYSAAFSPSRLHFLNHPALSWHAHTHPQMEIAEEDDSVHAHRDYLHEFWGTPNF